MGESTVLGWVKRSEQSERREISEDWLVKEQVEGAIRAEWVVHRIGLTLSRPDAEEVKVTRSPSRARCNDQVGTHLTCKVTRWPHLTPELELHLTVAPSVMLLLLSSSFSSPTKTTTRVIGTHQITTIV